MAWREALEVGLVVVGSLGGGGAIVFGMSSWLGGVWAARVAERERLSIEKQLASERERIDTALARLDASLEHRNLVLERLADIELQGLRECWQRARECNVFVNGLRPVDCGVDENAFDERWAALKASHDAFLSKFIEFEPFLEESIIRLMEEVRRVVALEISQSQRERFAGPWWDQGAINQRACQGHIAALQLDIRRRVANLRRVAEA